MQQEQTTTSADDEMPLQTEVNYAAVVARVAVQAPADRLSRAIVQECELVLARGRAQGLLPQAEIVEHLYREYTTPPL